jgi:hypothetical protein
MEINTEEPRDNKPSNVVVKIAADDLVVGLEGVKLRDRSTSLFLKAASKPLSAMFGSDWKEDHTVISFVWMGQ